MLIVVVEARAWEQSTRVRKVNMNWRMGTFSKDIHASTGRVRGIFESGCWYHSKCTVKDGNLHA
jgi:hypothetical protein